MPMKIVMRFVSSYPAAGGGRGWTFVTFALVAEPKKKSWRSHLRIHHRLVLLNEDTFEETLSFRLRPMNVFVGAGLIIIFLIILTTILIAFTGLREYIPGYSDVNLKRKVNTLVLKTDSMQTALDARDKYLDNIRNIINGDVQPPSSQKSIATTKFDTIATLRKTKADSLLRQEIESREAYSLSDTKSSSSGISGFLFFPPVKGTITSRFNSTNKHFGIDIAGPANEAIKATLDGTVIMAGFTSETGYTIGIQHGNNLFSFYKHCSALLKKSGDFVKAGEVIAIIGSSGELTTGPHLHFELWYNGSALDPQKYVAF
jgi:murein DD-endopeptidase MepM/ murein hydrolase activator NlpD